MIKILILTVSLYSVLIFFLFHQRELGVWLNILFIEFIQGWSNLGRGPFVSHKCTSL